MVEGGLVGSATDCCWVVPRLLGELAWRFKDKERLRVFLFIIIILIVHNSNRTAIANRSRNVPGSVLIQIHFIVLLVIANHRRDFRLLHSDKLLRSLLTIAMAQLIMVMLLIVKMLLLMMSVKGRYRLMLLRGSSCCIFGVCSCVEMVSLVSCRWRWYREKGLRGGCVVGKGCG